MSKKKIGIIIGVVAAVIVIAAVAICIWLFGGKGGGNSSDKVYVEQISTIMKQTSAAGNRFSGIVEPQETLEINKDSERTVKEVLVSVGDSVEEGTVLFSYDTEDVQMQIQQARLEIESINNEISGYNNQIADLQREKAAAPAESQFEYTTQIQTLQTSIRQSEYNKQSKLAEIERLQKSIDNSEVKSTMAGVVKSINETGMDSYGNAAAYMTILATGEYRVKGIIDETAMGMIMEGSPVILHSRVDETQTWTGTVSKIDTENTVSNNNNWYYDSDEMSSASSYPFYVTLDSTEGLMLGQHLYIELDFGQTDVVKKEGLWLYSYYIVLDDGDPYVWAANGRNRMEKRKVELGEYDENMDEYEILSGLDAEDYIAFPMPGMYEGVTAVTDYEEVDYSSPLYNQEGDMDGMDDMDIYDDMGGMDDMDIYDDMDGMDNIDGMDNMEGIGDPEGADDMEGGDLDDAGIDADGLDETGVAR